MVPPTVPIPPPALLHKIQESCAFALEHVLIRKVKKAPTRSLAPSAYHHIVSRPFNRDKDALFIHEAHFQDFVDTYMETTPSVARHLVFDVDIYHARGYWYGEDTARWPDFQIPAGEKWRGLRSVSFVGLGRCENRLHAEACGERESRGYYRAVADSEAVAWLEYLGQALKKGFECRRGPESLLREVKVVRGELCGSAGGDDDDGLLECSQVVLQRVTASTVADDWFEWYSERLISAWETWA